MPVSTASADVYTEHVLPTVVSARGGARHVEREARRPPRWPRPGRPEWGVLSLSVMRRPAFADNAARVVG